MRSLLKLSTDTTTVPWAKRTFSEGLESVVAVAFALSVGHALGHPSAGAIAAGSAFTVGFATFHRAMASTLLSLALATAGVASATLVGSLCAQWTPLVLLVVLIAAINFGLLSSLGPTASWIGQQSAVFVIVASYFPRGVHYAIGRMAMVLAGGALQMVVFAIGRVIRRRTLLTRSVRQRVRSHLGELWSSLRLHTHLLGNTGAYIARLSITLLITTAIYRHFHVRNGYWSPMTAVLVLKPQWNNTLSRGIARLVGTVAGAGVALLLARYLPAHTDWIFVLVIFSAWACYALQAVNYAAFSFFVTLYIVFLFRFGGFSQTYAAHIRLYNTLLGGGIALLIDFLWRTFAPRRASAQSQHDLI